MNAITMNGYTRISKATAIKLFKTNTIIRIVPCKYRPDNQWISYDLDRKHLVEMENTKQNEVNCFENVTDKEMFVKMVNSFEYYNCNNETGYYPAFYIKA